MSYHKYDLPKQQLTPTDPVVTTGCLAVTLAFGAIVSLLLWIAL